MQAVKADENNRINSNEGMFFSELKNRIRIKIPAVTKVDEWTKADTGVGAAIAAGNHLINGNWALFVIAAITKRHAIKVWKGEDQGLSGIQWVLIHHAIVNKIRTSPSRFVMAVIIAAPWDFGVW